MQKEFQCKLTNKVVSYRIMGSFCWFLVYSLHAEHANGKHCMMHMWGFWPLVTEVTPASAFPGDVSVHSGGASWRSWSVVCGLFLQWLFLCHINIGGIFGVRRLCSNTLSHSLSIVLLSLCEGWHHSGMWQALWHHSIWEHVYWRPVALFHALRPHVWLASAILCLCPGVCGMAHRPKQGPDSRSLLRAFLTLRHS